MEIYKDISNYKGYYQVSNLGNIKSLKREVKHYSGGTMILKEKILKPFLRGLKRRKYKSVKLCYKGIQKTYYIHVLLAMSFFNYRLNNNRKLIVDHIDNNQFNNRLNNLQIVTYNVNASKNINKSKTTSKYTGVSWSKEKKKWVSEIILNRKHYHLGYYNDEIKAHNSYLKKINEL